MDEGRTLLILRRVDFLGILLKGRSQTQSTDQTGETRKGLPCKQPGWDGAEDPVGSEICTRFLVFYPCLGTIPRRKQKVISLVLPPTQPCPLSSLAVRRLSGGPWELLTQLTG